MLCVFVPVAQSLTPTKYNNIVFDVFLAFAVLSAPAQYELLGLAFYRTNSYLVLRIFGVLVAAAETVVSLILVAKVNITRLDPLQIFSPASGKVLHSHLVSMYATIFAVVINVWPIGVVGLYMVLIPFYPLFQSKLSNMLHLCILEFALGIIFVSSYGVSISDFAWRWVIPIGIMCLAFIVRTQIDFGK